MCEPHRFSVLDKARKSGNQHLVDYLKRFSQLNSEDG